MFSSYAFTSDWPVPALPVITLCTAVALMDAIEETSGVTADIKWPNDLLVDGHKVAGILVESSGDVVTVGCGANLWWSEPPPYARAILQEDPERGLARTLAQGWVDRLVAILGRGHRAWPKSRYLERSWTIGKDVTWDSGSGRALGLTSNGGLIVDTPSGEVVITAGEVHTRQKR
jgi:BirA family biotin operon repressor/biotin-[acetyl-CoA-carboxylase] ligase